MTTERETPHTQVGRVVIDLHQPVPVVPEQARAILR